MNTFKTYFIIDQFIKKKNVVFSIKVYHQRLRMIIN